METKSKDEEAKELADKYSKQFNQPAKNFLRRAYLEIANKST